MKLDDPIVIQNDRGGWTPGKVLELSGNGVRVGIGEPGQIGYEHGWCERHEVKRYEPLPENAWDREWESRSETVLTMLNVALRELVPGEVAEIKDGVISAYGGAVTMQPELMEVNGIGVVRQVVGWSVSVTHWTPATQWHPEESDVASEGEFRAFGSAVQKMVSVIHRLKSEDYWTAMAEAAMEQVWANEPYGF